MTFGGTTPVLAWNTAYEKRPVGPVNECCVGSTQLASDNLRGFSRGGALTSSIGLWRSSVDIRRAVISLGEDFRISFGAELACSIRRSVTGSF